MNLLGIDHSPSTRSTLVFNQSYLFFLLLLIFRFIIPIILGFIFLILHNLNIIYRFCFCFLSSSPTHQLGRNGSTITGGATKPTGIGWSFRGSKVGCGARRAVFAILQDGFLQLTSGKETTQTTPKTPGKVWSNFTLLSSNSIIPACIMSTRTQKDTRYVHSHNVNVAISCMRKEQEKWGETS